MKFGLIVQPPLLQLITRPCELLGLGGHIVGRKKTKFHEEKANAYNSSPNPLPSRFPMLVLLEPNQGPNSRVSAVEPYVLSLGHSPSMQTDKELYYSELCPRGEFLSPNVLQETPSEAAAPAYFCQTREH